MLTECRNKTTMLDDLVRVLGHVWRHRDWALR
ncbi:hypothetical protein LSH36_57g03024 [Paralvinella palmiformis]|uniref:Uncharacterized protein n=1 Tax=Paralvinella palmiformis TaxID=53620 RepID=A0AAD9K504_9ANNE|nr:hypothetical protein LSH36_57g03024 [Paralvinella palmiformis]